ncbi:MAG TPA: VWA domain-containing protein [Bryobacteraceae bacterium]
MIKALLAAAAVSVLLVSDAQSQQQSHSVIRSDSRLVLVDSIVTDRKGAYITGLTQKDFKVWEDGKEQAVSTFSVQADQALSGNHIKHNLVLFFDNSTVAPTQRQYGLDAATKFVASNAGPDQLIAIAEFGAALRVRQSFTDDVDRLKRALAGARVAATAGDTGISSGTYVAAALTNYSARTLLGALRDMATRLASVPGRKTIVLFSGGLAAHPAEINAAVDACNFANVAIYPVRLHPLASNREDNDLGLSSGDASARYGSSIRFPQDQASARRTGEADVQSLRDALDGLAKGTGGFSISRTDDLPAGVERIANEQNEYYMLGYVPAQEPRPGACHAIKVKVDRGGAAVRSLSGYCEAKNLDVLAGTPTQRELEARMTANAPPTVQASMQAPFFYISPNIARVNVALDIPGAGVKFTKDKGRFEAKLNVIGIAYLPDGGMGARFSDSVNLTLDGKKQVDEFTSRSYHYETQFEMPSGQFNLKVAFSSSADSFGRVEMPLSVDPWGPTQFLLSGLALSKSAHPASDAGLLGDKVPLVSNGVQFIPSGTNHFHKAEEGFIYAEIYEPALALQDGKESPGLYAQMILLDAKTEKLVKDFGVTQLKVQTQPGNPAVPVGLKLPIADLTPGSYIAQITALDSTGRRSTRKIGFALDAGAN